MGRPTSKIPTATTIAFPTVMKTRTETVSSTTAKPVRPMPMASRTVSKVPATEPTPTETGRSTHSTLTRTATGSTTASKAPPTAITTARPTTAIRTVTVTESTTASKAPPTPTMTANPTTSIRTVTVTESTTAPKVP